MKNKLIIGCYLPNNSVIHRLDPRAKLIFVFVFIIFIFFAHSFATFAWVILLILCFMKMAKIQFWFLIKGLTPIFFFLIFTFLMHIFFTHGGTTLLEIGFIKIDSTGVLEGIFISLRLITIVMVATIMTLSTSPIDLTDAFEKLMAPLMIPLFISAFQRADELAIAMEVRGYDANVQRTSYRKLSWHKRDTLSLFSLIPIGMILFILKYMGV